jgi:hypothetical protein
MSGYSGAEARLFVAALRLFRCLRATAVSVTANAGQFVDGVHNARRSVA